MKRKIRRIIKKIPSLVLMIGLLVTLTSCEMWYKDWKGYLEYWSSTVQIGKIEVSNITIQKDINNKSTISTEVTPVITGYIINPQGYSFENTTIGSSDEIDKTVRIDNQEVKKLAKINSTDTTSISVQIAAASQNSQSLEHQDFTVTIAPVRTETGVSQASQSISLRYNTPPVAPIPVNYDGTSYSIPSGDVIWKQKDGKLYWAWEKGMNTADGANETAQNCVASFAINGKSIPVTALTKTVQTIDSQSYDVYSYDIGTATRVKLQALDSDGIAGKSRTTHVTQDVPVTPNPGTPNPDPGPGTTQEPSTVYVHSGVGNDSNDGLSGQTPLQSIDKALEIIYKLNKENQQQKDFSLILLADYKRTDFTSGRYTSEEGNIIDINATEQLKLTIASDTGENYSINANANGVDRQYFWRVLRIQGSVEVTLKNITLTGGYWSEGGGAQVNQGSTLIMDEGAKITNNTNGGGVYNEGIFTMTAGEISGNTNYGNGGGVYNKGTFTMEGGTITRNRLSGGGSLGSGVYTVTGGTFTQTGGVISGNYDVSGTNGQSHQIYPSP